MTYTPLEELASMSESAAVRRHFDNHNLGRLRLMALLFAGVSLIELLASAASKHPSMRVFAAGGGNVGLLLGLGFAFLWSPRGKKARPLKRVHGGTFVYIIAQYALLLLASGRSDGALVVMMVYPLMLLGIRLAMSELLVIHGSLALLSWVDRIVFPGQVSRYSHAIVIMAASVNICMFLANWMIAAQARRDFLMGWADNRDNAREQLRMRAELHAARAIQLSMLPDAPPSLPWLQIAARSIPAAEVGGDYYDYHVISNDRVAIMTADVAGHGLASGLVLAAIRSGFMLLRDEMTNPAQVLKRLHELVGQASRRRMLVTAALALFDRTRGVVTVCSAGHPPLVVRRGTGAVDLAEIFSPPLGVRLPVSIENVEVPFAAGDVFVLHTDGIHETRNPAGEVFGFERLRDSVARCDGFAAQQVVDALLAEVATFRGAGEQEDDITLVVARVV